MYCSVKDVAILCGFTEFTADTRPSISQVVKLILQSDHLIEMYCKRQGVILTSEIISNESEILKYLSSIRTAGMIALTYLANQQVADGTQAMTFFKMFNETIESFCKVMRRVTPSSDFLDDTSKSNGFLVKDNEKGY